jgi:colanic acid/amylovoran biosynthesis glycosyltransferase
VTPVVAHVIDHYLPRTQTFVYGYLRSFQRVRPAVISHKAENLDVFPLDSITFVPELGTLARGMDRAVFLASGHRPIRDRRYRTCVAATGASVIHGHFGWSAPLTVPLKRDLGLPLVTTFYGMDLRLHQQREWREAYDGLFEAGDVFFVEGSHMRRQLTAIGCPSEKVVVRHIGVDTAKIPFAERDAPESGPVRVLMCSSFVEKKGVEYGIRAFSQVSHLGADVRLVIAGGGPLQARIEGLVHELGLEELVDRVGYVSHDGFFELASKCHVFMAPSVTAADGDTEGGAPTVVLEAQACGLPVVATRHADIPEATVEGGSALLVPERDVDQLAACLAHLISQPELWGQMGRCGRQHVEGEYELGAQAGCIEDTYLELIDSGSEAKEAYQWT